MYDKDHLIYDDYGLKQVNCVRCNNPVKMRNIKLHEFPDGRTIHIYAIKTLSNFVPLPYELSNGTYTHITMDKDCARDHVDTAEERKGMEKQFRKGFELEAKGFKKQQNEIDDIINRYSEIKVTGRRNFKHEVKPKKEK